MTWETIVLSIMVDSLVMLYIMISDWTFESKANGYSRPEYNKRICVWFVISWLDNNHRTNIWIEKTLLSSWQNSWVKFLYQRKQDEIVFCWNYTELCSFARKFIVAENYFIQFTQVIWKKASTKFFLGDHYLQTKIK